MNKGNRRGEGTRETKRKRKEEVITMRRIVVLIISFLLPMTLAASADTSNSDLQKDFYQNSCPVAENLVRNLTWARVAKRSELSAKLLRLQYHDCFVRRCDASLLLDSTNSDVAEKDSPVNFFLSGYDVIDEIKAELENHCPGIVSCADILALVARDAVSFQAGKPLWDVFTGRRDGLVSKADEAANGLPSPSLNIGELEVVFTKNGLSLRDLVVLSGAHTIGVAPCIAFSSRLSGDPTMNATYAETLKKVCQSGFSKNVSLDPEPQAVFNNHYYAALKQHQGLMNSDAALLQRADSIKIIDELLQGEAEFIQEFGKSMANMGAIQVLTKAEGKIRKNCRVA